MAYKDMCISTFTVAGLIVNRSGQYFQNPVFDKIDKINGLYAQIRNQRDKLRHIDLLEQTGDWKIKELPTMKIVDFSFLVMCSKSMKFVILHEIG